MVRRTIASQQLDSAEVILIQNLQAGNYQSVTPTGTIDGVNTAFTLSAAPVPASTLFVFLNGAYQTAGGVDFTLSGSTITFLFAPPSGAVLRAYFLRDTA